MNIRKHVLRMVRISAICLLPIRLWAQSVPTSTQKLKLSAFIAATQTPTVLDNGENLDITSGMDLTLHIFHRLEVAGELRGSYPMQGNSVSSQQSYMSGPKIEYPVRNIRPYFDCFIGRGRITYLDDGYVFRAVRYIRSDSLIFSPGIGLDLYLNHRTAIKIDFQYQSWNTPAVASGRITPGTVTVGTVYRFDFNSRHPE